MINFNFHEIYQIVSKRVKELSEVSEAGKGKGKVESVVDRWLGNVKMTASVLKHVCGKKHNKEYSKKKSGKATQPTSIWQKIMGWFSGLTAGASSTRAPGSSQAMNAADFPTQPSDKARNIETRLRTLKDINGQLERDIFTSRSPAAIVLDGKEVKLKDKFPNGYEEATAEKILKDMLAELPKDLDVKTIKSKLAPFVGETPFEQEATDADWKTLLVKVMLYLASQNTVNSVVNRGIVGHEVVISDKSQADVNRGKFKFLVVNPGELTIEAPNPYRYGITPPGTQKEQTLYIQYRCDFNDEASGQVQVKVDKPKHLPEGLRDDLSLNDDGYGLINPCWV